MLRRWPIRTLVVIALACASATPPSRATPPAAAPAASSWVAALESARRQSEAIPVLSAREPDAGVERGYALQRDVVAARLARDERAGFKAALTSPGARAAFGSSDPAWGVLFASGRRSAGAEIDVAALRRPIVEVEIGFVFAERVARPIADVPALRALVRGVLPVVEIPETGFAPAERLRSADLVAANAGSALFLVGAERAPGDVDPGMLEVRLARDGTEVARGRGSDALGDPWAALLWLANAVVARGEAIEPGEILITGALGRPVPAEPGSYEATFGALGDLSFGVQARSGSATR